MHPKDEPTDLAALPCRSMPLTDETSAPQPFEPWHGWNDAASPRLVMPPCQFIHGADSRADPGMTLVIEALEVP
jgi:hypothetical protein